MDTYLRLILLALAFSASTAVLIFIVSKFKHTKYIYGAYLLFALAIASGIWSVVSPNTGGWDDIIFMIYAMIFTFAGFTYLLVLWIIKALKHKS